jgi:hypothetical protein
MNATNLELLNEIEFRVTERISGERSAFCIKIAAAFGSGSQEYIDALELYNYRKNKLINMVTEIGWVLKQ